MSTFSIREISEMINRCPKAIHKQIRMEKLKARKEFSYITSPYIVEAKDFAKYLCETPSIREDFKHYILKAKETKTVTVKLREVAEYMRVNPNWFVYSAIDLSKLFDVTPQSIHNWVRKGYLKEDFAPGLYSRESAIALTKKHPRFYKFMPKGGLKP